MLGEKKDKKVDIVDLDLSLKLQDIHLEMECLFPRWILFLIHNLYSKNKNISFCLLKGLNKGASLYIYLHFTLLYISLL